MSIDLTVTDSSPFDFGNYFSGTDLAFATESGDSPTGFTLTSAFGFSIVFGGTGFTYPDGSGDDIASGGTINSITVEIPNGSNPPTILAALSGLDVTIAALEQAAGQGTAAVLAAFFDPNQNENATFTAQNFDPSNPLNAGIGSGIHTLTISGSNTSALVLNDTSIQNFDILQLGSPAFNGKGQVVPDSFTITMADGNVTAGHTVQVYNDLGPSGSLFFDASLETNGNYNVAGGDGQDQITTGAGNDTIFTGGDGLTDTTGQANRGTDAIVAGAGDDSITVTDKKVTILGDDGNDTVTLGEIGWTRALSSNDFMNGGNGIDTLVFQSGNETDKLTAITDFEVFRFEDGFQFVGGSFKPVTGAYNITASDSTVAAGSVLTVDGRLLTQSNLTFNGGSETDGSYIFYGSMSADPNHPATDTFVGSKTLGSTFNFGGGSSAAIAHLTGGSGADSFNFTFGAFVNSDIINGGGGNDTLTISGDYSTALTLKATTLSSVENVVLTAGNSYDFVLADIMGSGTSFDGTHLGTSDHMVIDARAVTSEKLFLLGGAGSDTLTGGAGDQLNGGGGDDLLDVSFVTGENASGGDGNDTINVGNAFGPKDLINGGAGNDTVIFSGNYGTLGTPVTLSSGNFQDVEKIQLTKGSGTSNVAYYLSLTDGVVSSISGSAPGVTVDGSQLGKNDIANIDGSHVHSGPLTLLGGLGPDTLVGGSAGDTIAGGNGSNTITGGGGADMLSGGTGIDQFDYNAVSDSTVKSTGNAFDTIGNFDLSHDRLHFAGLTVSAVDAMVNGATTMTAGAIGNALKADLSGLQAGHAVLYNGQDGHLYLVVDAHGATGFQLNNDYVIDITGALNHTTTGAGGLTTTDFV